ncbi:hypothetical protein Tco_0600413 [Tanacetum coccineum]|uniref:Uncharacterized protein n=1 Tax=Tanacetum coccineum TaxID=301880 RepID=A0ABQ4WBT6_9ASTR
MQAARGRQKSYADLKRAGKVVQLEGLHVDGPSSVLCEEPWSSLESRGQTGLQANPLSRLSRFDGTRGEVNEARGAKDTLGILFWGVMHKRFGVITS